MPRRFSDDVRVLPKDRVDYLNNALEYRIRAPKQPLKGTLRAFCYKVVIRERVLTCSGLLMQTSAGLPRFARSSPRSGVSRAAVTLDLKRGDFGVHFVPYILAWKCHSVMEVMEAVATGEPTLVAFQEQVHTSKQGEKYFSMDYKVNW